MKILKYMLCPKCLPVDGILVVIGDRAYCQTCNYNTKVHNFTITEIIQSVPDKCLYKEEDGSCTHPGNRSCCKSNLEREYMDALNTEKICYQCEKPVHYLFDDGRCKDCTRMTPEEVRGEIQTDED